jgi:hypothetical protein
MGGRSRATPFKVVGGDLFLSPSPRSAGRGRGEAAWAGVGRGGPEVPWAEKVGMRSPAWHGPSPDALRGSASPLRGPKQSVRDCGPGQAALTPEPRTKRVLAGFSLPRGLASVFTDRVLEHDDRPRVGFLALAFAQHMPILLIHARITGSQDPRAKCSPRPESPPMPGTQPPNRPVLRRRYPRRNARVSFHIWRPTSDPCS